VSRRKRQFEYETYDGRHKVKGLVADVFGIRDTGAGYAVTHLPTGLNVATCHKMFESEGDALRFIYAIRKIYRWNTKKLVAIKRNETIVFSLRDYCRGKTIADSTLQLLKERLDASSS